MLSFFLYSSASEKNLTVYHPIAECIQQPSRWERAIGNSLSKHLGRGLLKRRNRGFGQGGVGEQETQISRQIVQPAHLDVKIHGKGRGGVYLFAGAMEFFSEDFATMTKKKIFIKNQKFYHPVKKVSDG
jgi:hypothetical protein